ncbi:UTRA domain-containing protein [Salibacterium aidingense]|uniref:UTRA domain-containing protein n=1 Tax=Salibacterium aidingense TaxID=384933 RepID=UPI003BC41FA2
MKLNESSQKPLYVQLKDHLKEEISRGIYEPGKKLPPESALCKEYGVSRITARRAISDLVEEDVLHRQQGKGTFVKETKKKRKLVSVGGFSEITSASGENPKTQILSSKIVPVEKIDSIFDVEEDSYLLELHRLLYIDDEPFIIETSYYPLQLLPDLESQIGSFSSTYQVLKEKYGVEIQSSDKSLNVVSSTDYEAELFKSDIGVPLYQVDKIAYDQIQRAIHFSRSLFLANKVTFTLSIDKNEN